MGLFITFVLLFGVPLQISFALECGEFTSPGILQTRIVNGELAALGEFPWQVSIQKPAKPRIQGINNDASKSVDTIIIELKEDVDVLDGSRRLWSQIAHDKNVTYDEIINWPPPIPTHPPDHTIPPLPTHPWEHVAPTHPPTRPMPTFPPPPPPPQNPWMPPPPPKPWHPPPKPPQQLPMPTLPPRPNPPSQPSKPWNPQPKPPQQPPMPTLPPRPNPIPQPPKPWNPQPKPPQQPPMPTLPPRPNPIPQPPQRPQPKPRPPVDTTQTWRHFCGGSIIDKNWILTAAHCVENMKHSYVPNSIRIVAGSLDWRHPDMQQSQVISVDRIVVNDGWSQKSGQNDVALLHLQTPLEYIKEDRVIVNRICLSHVINQEHTGTATSSGWGFLSKNHRVVPDHLRRVDIPIVNHAVCRNSFSRVIGITQMQVCAGQAPKGNCMGDSGGPLIQKEGNKAVQIGIVSFSIPCAVPGYPDVFTRVSKYLDWIITNTGLQLPR